jgi:hypothetical protein
MDTTKGGVGGWKEAQKQDDFADFSYQREKEKKKKKKPLKTWRSATMCPLGLHVDHCHFGYNTKLTKKHCMVVWAFITLFGLEE